MNDWISHHMGKFWAVCIGFGMLAGAYGLWHEYGLAGGILAGGVGGAGAALMLSISRYIAADDTEDDVRR
jgi:hypothetical protein